MAAYPVPVRLGRHFGVAAAYFSENNATSIDGDILSLVDKIVNPPPEESLFGGEVSDQEKEADHLSRVRSLAWKVRVRNELGNTEVRITSQMLSLIGITKEQTGGQI